jgi:anti-sigma regulatory factor (Ser/Thr protein kinase)
MSTRVDLRLRPSMEAPSNARRALDDLSPHLPAEVLDDMRLLVSELVTNSIRHAELSDEEWVGLHIEVAGDTVRVEVVDPGPGFRPNVPTPVVYQESGWGLYLVEQVAHRWGVVDDGTIRVWFEIDGISPSRSK